ncbi:MAG: PD-(D/E)XK nuclease family protein [Puniceicoccales bacterium]|jgi:hypothetical protein|nr:PD-(D/E)XK nuclease family protein [Puniceicoccales bacterium]
MATHVIGSISKFIGESGINFAQSVLVVPTFDDIWQLKLILSEEGIDLQSINFLTAHELRENLMEAFGVRGKFCSPGLVSLFFDEVAGEMQTDDCVSNAIVAGKNLTLQAFYEIFHLAIKPSDFFSPKLCSFFEILRRKIAENDFMCEWDADKLLLGLSSAAGKFLNWRIVFHGFQPFDKAKVLMEAAAKCCTHSDIITHDFGDAEFIHLWLNTLERIFGECKFYPENDSSENSLAGVNFLVCETVVDEVDFAVDAIEKILSATSSAKIGICFGGAQSVSLPMFLDKLELRGISYCDGVGRCGKDPKNWEVIVSLWDDWQTGRDTASFCRFCAELLANDLLAREDFNAIATTLPGLQGKCMSENYDIVLEFANLKNVHSFDIVERYDMHGKRFQFEKFCKNFIGAFAGVLPQKLLDTLAEQLSCAHVKKFFPRDSLIKYFSRFVRLRDKNCTINASANVVLIGVDSAYKQNFTHVFVPGMSAKDFDPGEDNCWLPEDAVKRINSHATEESNGERTICGAQNYFPTHSDRLHLQHAIFDSLGRRSSLFFSFAAKNFSGDGAQVKPAKIFSETLHTLRGEFYTKEMESKLLAKPVREFPLRGSLSDEDRKSIENCASSYAIRHNLEMNLHDYCFAIDKKFGVKISCKSFEYLLKNPHLGFYDSVLKLPPMPWQSKTLNRKISLGSFAHEFLQIFEAGSDFVKKTSPEIFHGNVDERAGRLRSMVAKACAAADAPIPSGFTETMNSAIVAAKRLIRRVFSLRGWESFRSEYSIPRDLAVRIGEEEVKLSGRLDFLLSTGTGKEDNPFSSAVTVIDFKTGSDFELTEKNVAWHMQRYSSLQLFLYALALRTIGFGQVKILLLKPDSGESTSAIAFDYIVDQTPELLDKLQRVVQTGLIERQIFGKVFSQYFADSIPLATTDLR